MSDPTPPANAESTEMKDLFQINEQLSPRLAWMKNHNVSVRRLGENNHINCSEWLAYVGKMPRHDGEGAWAGGDTEDEAIVNLAKCCGWLLWNEETAATKPLNAKR